jgi:hypothetical protein
LLHNETVTRGHYLRLSLYGARPGGDATGARITVEAGGRTLVHAVTAGGSYLSASDRRILIGLGAATHVDRLTIGWPSEAVQTWNDLPVDRSLAVVEGREPSPAAEAPAAGDRLNGPPASGGREPTRPPP